MENIIEQTKPIVASRTNVTKTIVKLISQLKSLTSFEYRKYIQETYPELGGSEYIQKVVEFRDETARVANQLASLIVNLQNQFLDNIYSGLPDWFEKQKNFPYKVEYSWTVVFERTHILHVILNCKYYAVHFAISIPEAKENVKINVYIKPKHKSDEIDAQIEKMCNPRYVLPSKYILYKENLVPIEKGLKGIYAAIKETLKILPRFK